MKSVSSGSYISFDQHVRQTRTEPFVSQNRVLSSVASVRKIKCAGVSVSSALWFVESKNLFRWEFLSVAKTQQLLPWNISLSETVKKNK